ncbi:MAG: DUF1460 domain-containing protein [Deltaproteobacteria bacterium]|nr:DUF1460 domain-containing protein [Deltaproteobacteria bacterium]
MFKDLYGANQNISERVNPQPNDRIVHVWGKVLKLKGISVIYQPEDRGICEELFSLPRWRAGEGLSVDELVVMVGKYFSGAPYVANTIEAEGKEALVINLRQFDCFTFVENCVVLAQLIEAGESTFEAFVAHMKRIRYRRGLLKGYSSRLHYFSDWVHDNEKKDVVKDITGKIGGKPFLKEVHFMTRHSENYPALKVNASYREMLAVEKRLSGQSRHVILKAGFEQVEGRIGDGNLIGITTDIEGLDVTHVGFAVWVKNHVHLLHASEKEKKVVVSKNTLNDYLLGKENMSGILIGQVQSIPKDSWEAFV